MADASWVVSRVLVILQTGVNDIDVDIDLTGGLFGGAVGAFVTTLVLGAILIAIAPEYTQRIMAVLEDEPVESFVYGLVALVALIILTILLVITILGIPLAILVILVLLLIWGLGAAIGYLLIADRLVGHEDGWTKPLLVGAAISGALALSGIGGLVAFGVGAAGFGAVVRDFTE